MKRIWRRLSKREKGLVGFTLLVLFLVLGRYFVVFPLMERQEWIKRQLELQPQLLEKNLRYLGRKAQIAAGLEKARGELGGLEPLLFTGDTPSVSASNVQEIIQNIATRDGPQVISTRVLNPETKGTFTKIPIQIEVSGQIDQLANLIKGIEAAEKLLVVDELNVRSLFRPVPAAPRPPQPSAVPALAPGGLRASLTIAGFARSQPAPAKGASQTPQKQEKSQATQLKSGAAGKGAEPPQLRRRTEDEE